LTFHFAKEELCLLFQDVSLRWIDFLRQRSGKDN